MEVAIPGLLDSLVSIEDEAAYRSLPWDENMVEIMPNAFDLNFRDFLMAMAQLQEKYLPLQCVRHISPKGAQVPEDLAIGQRVCALLQAGHWANKVRTPWTSVVPVPDGMSLETSALFLWCISPRIMA